MSVRIYGRECSIPYEQDEEPLKPGMVRIYEFLHGYTDITMEEYNEMIDDPLYKIFVEEVQKEIDREVIRSVCNTSG